MDISQPEVKRGSASGFPIFYFPFSEFLSLRLCVSVVR